MVMSQHAVFFKLTLVARATNDAFTCGFGFSCLGFDCYQPGILLRLISRLEIVLVAIEAKAKVVEVALYHVGHIGLQSTGNVSGPIPGRVGRILTKLKMPWG